MDPRKNGPYDKVGNSKLVTVCNGDPSINTVELSPIISYSCDTDYSLYLPGALNTSSIVTTNRDPTLKIENLCVNNIKENTVSKAVTTGIGTVTKSPRSTQCYKQNDHSKKTATSQFINIPPKRLKSREIGINPVNLKNADNINDLLQLPSDASYVGVAFRPESICNSFYEVIPTAFGIEIMNENNQSLLCENFETLSENNNSILSGIVSPISDIYSFPSSQCVGRGSIMGNFLPTSRFSEAKESLVCTYPSLHLGYITNNVATTICTPRQTNIERDLNGRLYHTTKKYIFKENICREKAVNVCLTEDAYDAQEEKRLIEKDENSRGQPPLKKLKIINELNSISNTRIFQENFSTPFSSKHDITKSNKNDSVTIKRGISKVKKKKLKKLSEYFFNTANCEGESSESTVDEGIKESLPFRCKSKPINNIGRKDGLSISEIFKEEFAEARKEFFSILKENDFDEKVTLLKKVKNVILSSSRSSRKLNRKSNNSYMPVKIESNNDSSDHENKLKDTRQLPSSMAKDTSKHQMSADLTNIQKNSSGENRNPKNGIPFRNQVHSLDNAAEDIDIIHIKHKGSGKAIDKVLPGIIANEITTEGQTRVSRHQSTSSESSVNKVLINDKKATSSLFVRGTNNIVECDSDFASHHPEHPEAKCKYKELRKSKSTISFGTTIGTNMTEGDLTSKSEIESDLLSSYVVPRKLYGKKDIVKRDKQLMDKLEHLSVNKKNEKKTKDKKSFFQKFVSLFRSKDDNDTSEKRKKFFYEQNEFFKDSMQAYSSVGTPYQNGDSVFEGMDSEMTPPRTTFNCTVSEGVFPVRVRKRKLGQSTLGIEDITKIKPVDISCTSHPTPDNETVVSNNT